MKKLMFASFALGAAFALIPSALADSFGYKTSGSRAIANLAIDTGHGGAANGVTETGASTVRSGSPNKAGTGTLAGSNSKTSSLTSSGDGGSPFDNLLIQGSSSNGVLNENRALAENRGNELNLLASGFSRSSGINSASGTHIDFAENGSSRASSKIPKGRGNLVATALTLTETPEPGSLFLLGTGLLFLALALFWKSAKRTTGS